MILLYSSHAPLYFGSTVHTGDGGGKGVRIEGSDKKALKKHSDCCKLIKNRWKEFGDPVNGGGGRQFFSEN